MKRLMIGIVLAASFVSTVYAHDYISEVSGFKMRAEAAAQEAKSISCNRDKNQTATCIVTNSLDIAASLLALIKSTDTNKEALTKIGLASRTIGLTINSDIPSGTSASGSNVVDELDGDKTLIARYDDLFISLNNLNGDLFDFERSKLNAD